MKSITDIKKTVARFARQIKAPQELLPTFSSSADFARPHIEVRGNSYHYTVVERGRETKHLITTDADELLYWVFRDVTSQMGYAYELTHHDPTRDFRRVAFAHTLGLLQKLDPTWKVKREEELVETISKFPFQDDLNI